MDPIGRTRDRRGRIRLALVPRRLAGDIDDQDGATRVLLDLAADRATGMWEIYADGRVHRIAMRSGAPIHAFAARTPWLLCDVMAALGLPMLCDEAEARRILAIGAGLSGRRLALAGATSIENVEIALREQIRLRAAEILAPREGRFRFFAGGSNLRGFPRQPDRWRAADLVAAIAGGPSPAGPARANEDLHRVLARFCADADPIEALGLPPGAGPAAVKDAFRRLALAHHPDRVAGSEPRVRALLHRRIFEAATEAYRLARAA